MYAYQNSMTYTYMSILFDIRFQLDATINCTFSNLNSKVETMGLGTCRGKEKMSEDDYSLTQLFQKSM